MQGDLGGNLDVRKVSKTINPMMLSKMGKRKAIIPDMEDSIRNSLLRVADNISGCSGNKKRFRILKEIGRLYHLEGDF